MAFRLASLVCLLIPAFAHAAEKESFRFSPGKKGTAELKVINRVPVLIVEGKPEDMGAGVGALALKPAKRVLGYPRDLLKWRDLEGLWPTLARAGKGMYSHFPAEYRKELEAMVESAGVDRDPVIAGNTFFDIKKSLACSAVLIEKEKSATGGPLLARNLDYPSLGYIHRYSLVTVYRGKDRLAFAAVGFPGLVGVLSGMNEAGLCLGVLEVFDIKIGEPYFDARGIPYGLCLRRVLEEAKTIDQAVTVLKGLRRTTTINVAIADRRGVAVLEVSPKRVVKRTAAKGVCACTNHFNSEELKPDKPLDLDESFERKAKLEEIRGWRGKVKTEDLRRQLDAVNLGSLTLQTMIFEPATLELHLSIGRVPASKGPLRTLELAELLGVQAGREKRADRR